MNIWTGVQGALAKEIIMTWSTSRTRVLALVVLSVLGLGSLALASVDAARMAPATSATGSARG